MPPPIKVNKDIPPIEEIPLTGPDNVGLEQILVPLPSASKVLRTISGMPAAISGAIVGG